jgi:hypothetical protein
MKLIKVTSTDKNKTGKDSIVYINTDVIGHIYTIPEKMSYDRVEEERCTVIGTTTHNNGGFRVKETVEEVLVLIKRAE